MSPTPQQQHDPFEQVAARGGAAARSSTERLPVTTEALHRHHQQRNTRRGIALGALGLAGAAVVAVLVLDRPFDTADVSPAEPRPSVSLAPPVGGDVTPRALESVGVGIATPPYWTLTDDGPDVATFEQSTPDGYRLTAMAFVPGSFIAEDGRHPVPQGPSDGPLDGADVRAWADTRTDITVRETGGDTTHLGLYRYVAYEAPADSPALMCPEPPSATTCSVPAPGVDTHVELRTYLDDADRTWAIIFYKDPQSPGSTEEIDASELIEAFHRN